MQTFETVVGTRVAVPEHLYRPMVEDSQLTEKSLRTGTGRLQYSQSPPP